MKKKGTVLVLKGKSQYSILRVSADHVTKALQQLGYEAILLDFQDDDNAFIQYVDYLQNKPIEFIFTFNAGALNFMDNDGTYILDYFDIPFITYLVDHPLYHINYLSIPRKQLSVVTFDHENVEFLKTHYPDIERKAFIPFIGFQSDYIKPYAEREIDLLFVGTYTHPDDIKAMFQRLPDVFCSMAEHVVEILLNNTELSLERGIKKYFEEIHFEVNNEEFLELMTEMAPVDKYMRNYFRDKVIRTVLNAGHKISVYGNGWNILKEDYPEQIILLGDPTEEPDLLTGIDYMSNAKIVLSVMPWFKDCIQDRIISTMLNGAVCVTDPSKYLVENLSADENIVFYSLDDIESLPNKLTYLLQNDEKASSIAKKGTQKAQTCFSTELFAKNLVANVSKNRKLHTAEDLTEKYKHSKDKDIIEILDFIKTYPISVYNSYFTLDYYNLSIEVDFDRDACMYYAMHNNKRMYYPKKYSSADVVAQNYRFVSLEQDPRSPHRYLDDTIYVKEGDVVIDAGVAEGNFSLDVIDKVSKLYIIECEADWMEALQQTFKPYADKVVFVNKFLSNKDDDYNITIDSMVTEKVNFIKMDIEGAELDALEGAHNTLNVSDDITCAICSYHKKGDEDKIKSVLNHYGFETSTSRGYMFFLHDEVALAESELRRGLVRGIKTSN